MKSELPASMCGLHPALRTPLAIRSLAAHLPWTALRTPGLLEPPPALWHRMGRSGSTWFHRGGTTCASMLCLWQPAAVVVVLPFLFISFGSSRVASLSALSHTVFLFFISHIALHVCCSCLPCLLLNYSFHLSIYFFSSAARLFSIAAVLLTDSPAFVRHLRASLGTLEAPIYLHIRGVGTILIFP